MSPASLELFRPGVRVERETPGRFVEAQNQRDRDGAGGEGDDDAGDDERLRHRIGMEARARAAPRDHAEEQEYAAADHAEGENLAQELRIDDEAVEAETDEDRPGDARNAGDRHDVGFLSGGPAISIGIDAAIESSMKTSTKRMTGFTKPGG